MCYLLNHFYNLIFRNADIKKEIIIIILDYKEDNNKRPLIKRHIYLTDKKIESPLKDFINKELNKEIKEEIILDFKRIFENRF